MQRIRQPDEGRWQHRILKNSNVVGVETDNKGLLGLHVEQGDRLLSQEFDAIVSLYSPATFSSSSSICATYQHLKSL